jgi:hypothetical protein
MVGNMLLVTKRPRLIRTIDAAFLKPVILVFKKVFRASGTPSATAAVNTKPSPIVVCGLGKCICIYPPDLDGR